MSRIPMKKGRGKDSPPDNKIYWKVIRSSQSSSPSWWAPPTLWSPSLTSPLFFKLRTTTIAIANSSLSLSLSPSHNTRTMEEIKVEEKEEVDNNNNNNNNKNKCGLKVLVVDDSPVDRTIVERLLKKSGQLFEVIAVDSGKKAMEVLGLQGKAESPSANDQHIDIILTDYCMPEMTGYDLLKAIKEHSCPKSIPVVVMSSENEPQRITRCRAIGAEDFIVKPLQKKDVERLRNCVKPMELTPKAGTKRKLPLELMAEGGGSERRPRLAGVVVA